jgi:hypothetical protein
MTGLLAQYCTAAGRACVHTVCTVSLIVAFTHVEAPSETIPDAPAYFAHSAHAGAAAYDLLLRPTDKQGHPPVGLYQQLTRLLLLLLLLLSPAGFPHRAVPPA